ncbi:unnamed protein product, partial [Mesorhabditis belari]|uniref:Uncharacterized protein n=1 Tax=Mesorhabditis belari TaxID=2138241 RepID=A0AAF3ETI2_9BILA
MKWWLLLSTIAFLSTISTFQLSPSLRRGIVEFEPVHKPIRKPVSGLDYCPTPKCMSTKMRTAMCDLFHSQGGRQARKTRESRSKYNDLNSCEGETIARGPQWSSSLQGSTRFKIARDPLHRFVSAYLHLCKHSHKCGRHGQTIHRFTRTAYRLLKNEGINLGLGLYNKRFIRHHISPQSWFCRDGSRKILHLIDGNPRAIAKQVKRVFRSAGVPERVSRPIIFALSTKGKSSRAHDRVLQAILSNRETLRLFLQMYYMDYRTYHFPLTREIREKARGFIVE